MAPGYPTQTMGNRWAWLWPCRWETRYFVLDHQSLRNTSDEQSASASDPYRYPLEPLTTATSAQFQAKYTAIQRPSQCLIEFEGLQLKAPCLKTTLIPCRIALDDIADVKPCMDPSLPAGHAFWVSLQSMPTGLYFCAGMPHKVWQHWQWTQMSYLQ